MFGSNHPEDVWCGQTDAENLPQENVVALLNELLGLVALFKKYVHVANMHVYMNYIDCSIFLHLRHGCLEFIRQFINYAASFS